MKFPTPFRFGVLLGLLDGGAFGVVFFILRHVEPPAFATTSNGIVFIVVVSVVVGIIGTEILSEMVKRESPRKHPLTFVLGVFVGVFPLMFFAQYPYPIYALLRFLSHLLGF